MILEDNITKMMTMVEEATDLTAAEVDTTMAVIVEDDMVTDMPNVTSQMKQEARVVKFMERTLTLGLSVLEIPVDQIMNLISFLAQEQEKEDEVDMAIVTAAAMVVAEHTTKIISKNACLQS